MASYVRPVTKRRQALRGARTIMDQGGERISNAAVNALIATRHTNPGSLSCGRAREVMEISPSIRCAAAATKMGPILQNTRQRLSPGLRRSGRLCVAIHPLQCRFTPVTANERGQVTSVVLPVITYISSVPQEGRSICPASFSECRNWWSHFVPIAMVWNRFTCTSSSIPNCLAEKTEIKDLHTIMGKKISALWAFCDIRRVARLYI